MSIFNKSSWPTEPAKFYAEGDVAPVVDDPDTKDDNNDEDEEDDEEGKEEDEEDKEDEGETKEDDEELELTRVSYKDIKEKHPNFFKDFPDLKHAFFREQQFTEIFPTVEDAKNAAEAQTAYQEIRDAIVEGDASKFVEELKNEDPEGLEKFTANFLPALQESNKDLYFNTVGPIVQQFVKNVYNHGSNEKDDNVKNAAKIVHKILFGGTYEDIEKDLGKFTSNGRKDSSVEEDKKKYFATKYQNLYSDISNVCYSKLEEAIASGLSDLDKGNKGLKRVLISDIKTKVLSEMEKDKTHLQRMESLWKREQRAGFNGQLKQSFVTVFLAKAKTLIPKIRSEARKEVLGKSDNGTGKKEPTRIIGDRSSNKKGSGMNMERVKKEGLSTRQVFDD